MKLPSKQEWPDYYEVIKTPIDMLKISRRIKSRTHYTALSGLLADFDQMFVRAAVWGLWRPGNASCGRTAGPHRATCVEPHQRQPIVHDRDNARTAGNGSVGGGVGGVSNYQYIGHEQFTFECPFAGLLARDITQ